jgi:serine/threonine-protein kinase
MRSDVERHLGGMPIRARPDSVRYRASKFVVRNPWGVAAGFLALAAVGVSVVLPWQQNRRLTDERDKALAVQNFLLEAFGTTGGDESISARDLLDLQASRVDSLYGDRPELRAQMLLVLADAYDRLGLYAEALPSAERGLDILRGLHSGDHRDVAVALNTVGWALHRVGRREDAAERLEDAIAMRRRLGRGERDRLSRSLNDLGVVRENLGAYEAAAALHREALDIRRSVLGDADLATGISANNLATSLYRLGDIEAAVREAELALALLRASVGPDHQRTVIVQTNLAVFKVASGDFESAADDYRDLLDRQARLQGERHPVTNAVRQGLGVTLMRLERWDEADEFLTSALAVERDRGEAGVDRTLSIQGSLARVHAGRGEPQRGMDLLDDAVGVAERLRPGSPALRDLRRARGDLRVAAGDDRGAAEDYEAVVRMLEAQVGPASEQATRFRLRLVELLRAADRVPEADSVLDLVGRVVEAGALPSSVVEWFTRLDAARVGG